MNLKNEKLFKQECFINGDWVKSNNNQTLDVNNPSSLEIIGTVPKCGKEETKIAIEAANSSWDDWKARPAIERSALLRKWFNLIESNHEDLAQIMTMEQGKPITESRDRKSVVQGKSVDLGGRRIIKKKKQI